jgi:hypothetical protein
LLVAISREKPKLLSERVPGVPAELDLLVSKALRKRPVERFTDMQDFARALAPFGSVLAAAAAAQGPASSAIPAPPSSARRPEGARVSSTFLESSKDLPPESRTHRAVSIGLIVMAAALFATLVLGLGARWLAPGLGHTDDAAADDTASQKPRAFPAGPSASTAPASSAAPAPSTPVRIVPFATAAPVIAPSAAAASSEEATKPPPAQRAKRRPRRSDLGF